MRSRLSPTFAFLAVALIAVASACQPFGRGDPPTPTPPPDISAVVEVWSSLSQATPSPGRNPIVEVWNSLSKDFVEKDELDAGALSQAAIEAMLELQRDAGEDGKDGLDPATLSDAAIDGMLDALGDPYTNFMNSDEYKLYLEDSQGKFEGIGAGVNDPGGLIVITEPIPDTPAERAGILAGDIILEVDGASTEGWDLFETVLKIRGRKGTIVRLLVLHPDAVEPVLIEIVRGVIPVESVGWDMLPSAIAYLGISSFNDTTDEALIDALKEIEEQDAQGIILDLRGNRGGLLSATVTVASQFLTEGLVLYSADGDGKRIDYEVRSGGVAPDIPLVVLVNRFSASASEVLAGALQDHERAVLIGTNTFGKGSVNLPKRLSDGSGLYFTIARWYSPNGRLIEGEGLEPDIPVAQGFGGLQDLQLETAHAYLVAQRVAASS